MRRDTAGGFLDESAERIQLWLHQLDIGLSGGAADLEFQVDHTVFIEQRLHGRLSQFIRIGVFLYLRAFNGRVYLFGQRCFNSLIYFLLHDDVQIHVEGLRIRIDRAVEEKLGLLKIESTVGKLGLVGFVAHVDTGFFGVFT